MFRVTRTRGRRWFVAAIVVCALAAVGVAAPAEAQSVIDGYRVSLSRFGGDGTLPKDLGFLCLWDDGVWTLSDYIDIGFFVEVGKKIYLLGGVEGVEHLSMVFKKSKGDLTLGTPANETELPGQDVLIVAGAKRRRQLSGCTSREPRSRRSLLSVLKLAEDLAPRTRALR